MLGRKNKKNDPVGLKCLCPVMVASWYTWNNGNWKWKNSVALPYSLLIHILLNVALSVAGFQVGILSYYIKIIIIISPTDHNSLNSCRSLIKLTSLYTYLSFFAIFILNCPVEKNTQIRHKYTKSICRKRVTYQKFFDLMKCRDVTHLEKRQLGHNDIKN